LPRTISGLNRGLAAAAVLLVALPAAAPARPQPAASGLEVVVTMRAPALAELHARSLAFAGGAGRRLSLRSPQSVAYVRQLQSAQRALAARIERAVPAANVRWHYSVVVNGLAVVVPRSDLAQLWRVPGVAEVWPTVTYHALLDRTPRLIGAPTIWGPTLDTAGNGMKIGIIDQGIDQRHPFFNPTGFTYPAGFPKGNTDYTTPKVIVARSFPPPGATDPLETLPFVGVNDVDDHGTHVAGIAAGDANTNADGVRISGIAPKAYLGNYKAATLQTPDFGLNANTPELVAAIEAAVTDGMDVINLSFGEVEIPPSRDLVGRAINAAADAGVVPVVSAGNDYSDFGDGSVNSPANAAKAIAAAASSGGHGSPTPDRIESFSSAGPTAFDLRLKPDVTAPGGLVLSSVPEGEGLWDEFSGTSMAAPHVAGGAALLRERHPTWTVAQIKSSLELTGVPVHSGAREVPVTREGGGRINLVQADDPRVVAAPSSVSFQFLRPGRRATRSVTVSDAGRGAGRWRVRVRLQTSPRGVTVEAPASVTVPGRLTVSASIRTGAPEGDVSGFVVLTQGSVSRRIPLWFRVVRPRLGLDRAFPLSRAGIYRGSTVGAPARVKSYRYPDLSPSAVGFPILLPGPEVAYRFRLKRAVANFGVVLTQRGAGVDVQPRIVRNGDENRLAGYTALPIDLNPYRTSDGETRPVAGVVAPATGLYDLVFDSPRHSRRGTFAFRFWINDTTPPRVRVLSSTGGVLRIAVSDSGSGVDPSSLHASVDGRSRPVTYAAGIARVALTGIARGSHELTFRAADYPETKNRENVGLVLPNTRTLKTTITVR
jgi:subtilisin family serine protease